MSDSHDTLAPEIQYTADTIVTRTGLDVIRHRPSQFIPDTEIAGQTYIAFEPFDNAGDEALILGKRGKVVVAFSPDPKRETYQVIITDNGRGIPPVKLHQSCTDPHTSGKGSDGAYRYSSGLFGLGLKVTAGLSNQFRAITRRLKEGAASVYVKQGKHAPAADMDPTPTTESGTIIVYEPDPTMFTGVDTYAAEGWTNIADRIKKYSFFHAPHVQFVYIDKPLSKKAWTTPIPEAVQIIEDHIASGEPVFDSETFNREEWLRKYLGVTRPWAWSLELQKAAAQGDTMAYDIRMRYSKSEPGYSRFGMINSVPIDSATSNHISEIYKSLNVMVAKLITDSNIRKYFLESYRLPVYMAVEVKYEGAEFTGTTKHSFISAEFREEYGRHLLTQLSTPECKEAIAALFELVWPDIEAKYIAAVTGVTKLKHQGRLYQDLKFPEKFADCSAKDRSRTTLFLVEGDSAGSGIKKKRDGETMGIYSLRGKPYNGVDRLENISRSRIDIQKDNIYKDVIRILGLDPQKPDLNGLYYDKIVIMTDAD